MTPRSKSQRTVRLIRPPDANHPGLFTITTPKDAVCYVFREIPCAIGGRGFAMHRLGLGELYHVRIGRPHELSCECLGYLRHGRCKHLAALQTLIEHCGI